MNEKITISSGVGTTRKGKNQKQTIVAAYLHNFRFDNSSNVVNDNPNYYYDITTKTMKQMKYSKNLRGKKAVEIKNFYDKIEKEQYNLLLDRVKNGEVKNPPKKKDLKPIVEGIVNFGNVYKNSNEREEKTNEFKNKYTNEQWIEIMEITKNNLEDFCKKYNTKLLSFVAHFDEEGLPHFHYTIKNFDKRNGLHLGIHNNKNDIGNDLQKIISKHLTKFDLHQVELLELTKEEKEEKRKNKGLTKQELISRRTKKELETTKNELNEVEQLFKEDLLPMYDLIKMVMNELVQLQDLSEVQTKKKLTNIISNVEKLINNFLGVATNGNGIIDKEELENFNSQLEKSKERFHKVINARNKRLQKENTTKNTI